MLNRDHALVISEAVDDNRQLPADSADTLRTELLRQQRVDALLRASAPGMARPSPEGLADRIIAAVELTRPEHLILRRVGLSPLFAAAAALAIASLAWLTFPRTKPTTPTIDGNPLGSIHLPSDPTVPLSLSLESPYKSEARRLQEDTKRATDAVLAYLPLSR